MNDNKTNIFGEPIEENTNNIFSNNDINQNQFNNETVSEPVSQPAPTFEQTAPAQVTETPQKIEIPQKYYDKLAQEKAEREAAEQQERQETETMKEQSEGASALIGMIFINCVLILAIIYSYLNFNNKLFIALPGVVVVLSIINAITKKEKSDYPSSILVGGIFAAIITFIGSMFKEELSDILMYYALVSGITGIAGWVISSLITSTITKFKEMKALQTIGTFLLFAIIFGAPVYVYINYQEQVHRLLFFKQIEVKAETPEEYIMKTLKNRYDEDFTCDTKVRNLINQNKERMTVRDCKSTSGITVSVQSIDYEPSKLQYIIIDNYMDKRYFDTLKSTVQEDLKNTAAANSVQLHLYTNLNCNFVGDCVETEDYLKNKNEYNDRENKYQKSTSFTFHNKLPATAKEFLNENEFRYVITINGNYNGYTDQAFEEVVERVLSYLTNKGYKNTYGYDIYIKGANALDSTTTYNKLLYAVKGETNETQTFDNPEVVKVEK